MDFLDNLNSEQQRAVAVGDGPVLIVAGPGTGKTKTLTARIAFLLEKGVEPTEVLALTFTNKAAREMRERLASLLPDVALPKVTTFHALGHALLKGKSEHKLISAQEHQEVIRNLPKPRGRLAVRDIGLIISRAKTSLTPPVDEAVRTLLEKYEAILAEKKLYDFDDLLCKSYEQLRADKTKRPQYRYVLVDEFQDTSVLQYEMLKLVSAQQNIFAIGDPNQSIYAFRGAGAEMFDLFVADFPAATTIDLTTNYRSRPEITALANVVFPDAPQLVAHSQPGGRVQALQTLNEFSEAAYILNEIEKGIGGSNFQEVRADGLACQPRDYAVLYRTHRAAKALQKAFAEHGIPYQVAGEGSPYERLEVQAIIAVMRYMHASGEAPVIAGFTAMQIQTLIGQVPEAQNAHDLAAHIAVTFGFEVDQNLRQFLGMLVQFGEDVEAALRHIDDISEGEFYDPSINAVTLMTIHASKGLEFEHVFVIAAEEGTLPKLNAKSEGDIEEERRLFYVAATRAKQTLDLLYTKKRSSSASQLSRFVEALPTSVCPRAIDPHMEALEKRLKKKQQKRAQTSLF